MSFSDNRRAPGKRASSNGGQNRGQNRNRGRNRGQSGRQQRNHNAGGRSPGRKGAASNRQGVHQTPRRTQDAGQLTVAEPQTGAFRLGSWRTLLIFFVLVFLVAAVSGLFPPGAWYDGLSKPDWTPPNWLFGPAWTVLYLLLAIAGWLIYSHAPGKSARLLWAGQLALNAAWSWLFFGLHQPGWALLDVMLMSALSLALIVLLFKDVFAWSRLAGLVLIPYWAWVTFAAALNASIWMRAGGA